MKNYNGDEGHFLDQYPEELHKLHNDLLFLLVANFHEKKAYVIQMRNLKQALNNGLLLEKVHGFFKFNEKDWLKPYIDMSTELRKKAKNDF